LGTEVADEEAFSEKETVFTGCTAIVLANASFCFFRWAGFSSPASFFRFGGITRFASHKKVPKLLV
jgi:hypothetical protein